jgi:cell division protein FtsW
MVYSASIAIAEGSRFTATTALFPPAPCSLPCHRHRPRPDGVPAADARWQQLAPGCSSPGWYCCVLVLIPGIGREVNGAQRWLSLGPVNLQPSELMKLFAALYAADYTVRKLAVMGSFVKGFVPMMAVILLVGFLLLREPDFGAFVVITTIAFGVLFLGGVNVRVLFSSLVVAVIGFVILIWTSPYRRERIFGFMDPWQDAYGKGYQLSHSLIAFGRGEWFGVGLGGSVEKLFYLPEAHTDFLLAVIAEELGFAGVLTVVALFALVVQRAFIIGARRSSSSATSRAWSPRASASGSACSPSSTWA